MAGTSPKHTYVWVCVHLRVCLHVCGGGGCACVARDGRVGEEEWKSKVSLSHLPRGGTQEGRLGLEAVSSQDAKSTRLTTILSLVAWDLKPCGSLPTVEPNLPETVTSAGQVENH